MVLSNADVGSRIVVRHRIGIENGRTVYTDVLGVLESWTSRDVLTVRQRDGSTVAVDWSEVVAGKTVPAGTASGRPPATGLGLALVSASGWPALSSARLGDWLLQAADGFTGRANSVIPAGSPGMPLPDAISAVRSFYASHGLPARFMVLPGSSLESSLQDLGWRTVATGKIASPLTQMRVATMKKVRAASGSSALPAGFSLSLDEPLDDEWFALYGRGSLTPAARHVLGGGLSPSGTDSPAVHDEASVSLDPGSVAPAAGAASLGPGSVALARIRSSSGELAAIGRGVVTSPWLGISAIEVAPSFRRHGLAMALMSALCAWGAGAGALWTYLPVTASNSAAIALYDKLGFATDYEYLYYDER